MVKVDEDRRAENSCCDTDPAVVGTKCPSAKCVLQSVSSVLIEDDDQQHHENRDDDDREQIHLERCDDNPRNSEKRCQGKQSRDLFMISFILNQSRKGDKHEDTQQRKDEPPRDRKELPRRHKWERKDLSEIADTHTISEPRDSPDSTSIVYIIHTKQ